MSLLDFRFALRQLRKSPGLVLTAVLSLGLGIGLNTTLFSLIHSLLFRAPAIEAPDELTHLFTQRAGSDDLAGFSLPDLISLRETGMFRELVGHSLALAAVERNQQTRVMIATIVTDRYFEALGVSAAIGRTFDGAEYEDPAAAPVVVLSDAYWRSEFGARDSVVGETVALKGTKFTIVGVVSPNFTGLWRGVTPQFFVPIAHVASVEPAGEIQSEGRLGAGSPLSWRGYRFLRVAARLAEGSSLAASQGQARSVLGGLAAEFPTSNEGWSAQLLPAGAVRFDPDLDRVLVPAAMVLLGMVGLVLLVACANLASLLLARANGRRREIGVRIAIGASRGHLAAQLLTESLLLAGLGGAAGVAVAAVGQRLVSRLATQLPLEPTFDLRLDGTVLLFAITAALLTGVLFGLAPLLHSFRTDVVAAIKSESAAGAGRGGRGWRLQPAQMLVVVQMALSCILVVAASLMFRSTSAARDLDLGFDSDRVGTFVVDVEGVLRGEIDNDGAARFWEQLSNRAAAVPGVEQVAFASRLPLSINLNSSDFFIPGVRESESEPSLQLDVTSVSANYFDTLGISLASGRLFDSRDRADTNRVAIVTRAMEKRFWPEQGALGKLFRTTSADSAEIEIVGVVDDYKIRTPGEVPRPMVHFSADQRALRYGNLVFRSPGAAAAVLPAIRNALMAERADLYFLDVTTLDRMRDLLLLPVRGGSFLLLAMSGLALLLAVIGLSGLVAYWVSQRTREIGIRVALGAERGRIGRLVVSKSVPLLAFGALLGLGGGALLGKALSSVLYVGSADPLSLLAGAAMLVVSTALANLGPVRRATAVEPLRALRES